MTYAHSAKQKAPQGYVYFCIEMDRDRVKIGHARDPEKRIKALQTACSEELGILGAIPSRNPRVMEQRLHRRFAHLRLSGEWFRCTEEIGDFVELYGYDLTVDGVPNQRIYSIFEDDEPPKLRPMSGPWQSLGDNHSRGNTAVSAV